MLLMMGMHRFLDPVASVLQLPVDAILLSVVYAMDVNWDPNYYCYYYFVDDGFVVVVESIMMVGQMLVHRDHN